VLSRAFTREVPMDDQKDPKDPFRKDDLSWNWSRSPQWRPFSGQSGRGPRVPAPPGPAPRASKAQREQEKRAAERAARWHLVSLSGAGVVVAGVVLGAMVIVLVYALVSRH
jgi:hypothetical protein